LFPSRRQFEKGKEKREEEKEGGLIVSPAILFSRSPSTVSRGRSGFPKKEGEEGGKGRRERMRALALPILLRELGSIGLPRIHRLPPSSLRRKKKERKKGGEERKVMRRQNAQKRHFPRHFAHEFFCPPLHPPAIFNHARKKKKKKGKKRGGGKKKKDARRRPAASDVIPV